MTDIFGNNLFTLINFDRKFEGIVLENSNFLSEGYIKVYIPDIFLSENGTNIVEKKVSINLNKIENIDNLTLNRDTIYCNYLKCYHTVPNEAMKKINAKKAELDANSSLTDEEKVIELNQYSAEELLHIVPEVGERVIVDFVDGNPLLPYYHNKHYYRKEKYTFPIPETIPEEDKISEPITETVDGVDILYYYGGYKKIQYYNPEKLVRGSDVRMTNNTLYEIFNYYNRYKEGLQDIIPDIYLWINNKKISYSYNNFSENRILKNNIDSYFYYSSETMTAIKAFQSTFLGYKENNDEYGKVGPITFDRLKFYLSYIEYILEKRGLLDG